MSIKGYQNSWLDAGQGVDWPTAKYSKVLAKRDLSAEIKLGQNNKKTRVLIRNHDNLASRVRFLDKSGAY